MRALPVQNLAGFLHINRSCVLIIQLVASASRVNRMKNWVKVKRH